MRMRRRTNALLITTLLWVSGAGSALQAQNTATIGGAGGLSYSLKCPESQVLVGVGVIYGQWLDKVTGHCKPVDLNDGSTGSTVSLTSSVGKYHVGGNGTSAVCPSGYAVKGFKGNAGWYVHQITLICRKLGASARTQAESEQLRSIGAGGGTTSGPYSCGESKTAIGIQGKAGEYIDSFGLICGYLMPSTPVLVAPSNGIDLTTRMPTFDWDVASRITKPYNLCINLSPGAACSISGTIKASISAPTTQWITAANLPFARGDVVYWRIEACNDNGCRSASRSFRFMP